MIINPTASDIVAVVEPGGTTLVYKKASSLTPSDLSVAKADVAWIVVKGSNGSTLARNATAIALGITSSLFGVGQFDINIPGAGFPLINTGGVVIGFCPFDVGFVGIANGRVMTANKVPVDTFAPGGAAAGINFGISFIVTG